MNTTSQIVLPAVGVLATILVGLVTVWVTYAVGFPRRRLLYGLPVVTPVLSVARSGGDDLQITFKDTPLDKPHVVRVHLVGQGRKDIPSTAFDSGNPLHLDINANIVKVLQITSNGQQPVPKIAVDGSTLRIGPSLIGKRQRIEITLLVDGENPHLICQSYLENVDVREQRAGRFKVGPESFFGAATAFATIGISFEIIALLLLWVTPKPYVIYKFAGLSAKFNDLINSTFNADFNAQSRRLYAFSGLLFIIFAIVSIIIGRMERKKLARETSR